MTFIYFYLFFYKVVLRMSANQFRFDPNFNRSINSIDYERSLTVPQANSAQSTLQLNKPDFKIYDENPKTGDYGSHVVYGIHTDNALSRYFFSKRNIDYLQQAIQQEVFRRSGGKHVIGRQNDTELILIMRAKYFLDGHHQPDNIAQQVKFLNNRVITDVVPRILSEIQQYVMYTKDASSLPVPIEHGRNMSSKGSRTLPSVTSTF